MPNSKADKALLKLSLMLQREGKYQESTEVLLKSTSKTITYEIIQRILSNAKLANNGSMATDVFDIFIAKNPENAAIIERIKSQLRNNSSAFFELDMTKAKSAIEDIFPRNE